MTEPAVNHSLINRSYLVAGNLITSHKRLFLIACLILAVPEWLKIPLDHILQATPLELVSRICELILVCVLARKVIDFSTTDSTRIRLGSLLLVGFFVWLLLEASLPFWMKAPDELYFLALLGVSLSVGLTFLYWFHFIPALFGTTDPLGVAKQARAYHTADRWLPFRACLAPAGLLLIASGIVLSPWPDGRSIVPLYILPAIIGIYKALVIYLSVSFGLVFLSTALPTSFEEGFKTKLDQNLIEIADGSPKRFAAWLTAKNGLTLVFIGMLVWFGNAIKLETTGPAAVIAEHKLIAGENKLTLTLRLRDEKYLMRGLNPELFLIAGEKRTLISGGVISVKDGRGQEISDQLPETEDLTVTVEFMSERKAEEARKLTDAFIWYRYAKLSDTPVKIN